MSADVQCPKCGAKHFMLYGDQYRCPCGHEGAVADDRMDTRNAYPPTGLLAAASAVIASIWP